MDLDMIVLRFREELNWSIYLSSPDYLKGLKIVTLVDQNFIHNLIFLCITWENKSEQAKRT